MFVQRGLKQPRLEDSLGSYPGDLKLNIGLGEYLLCSESSLTKQNATCWHGEQRAYCSLQGCLQGPEILQGEAIGGRVFKQRVPWPHFLFLVRSLLCPYEYQTARRQGEQPQQRSRWAGKLKVVQCSEERKSMHLGCWGCRMVSPGKCLLFFLFFFLHFKFKLFPLIFLFYYLRAGTLGTSMQAHPPAPMRRPRPAPPLRSCYPSLSCSAQGLHTLHTNKSKWL